MSHWDDEEETPENIGPFSHLKDGDEFEYRSDVISKDHRDNKSKLQEGDNITFYWAKWNYRTNKNDVSEQTGKIIEIVDSSKEIVDFDVKVLPEGNIDSYQ